MKLKNTLALSLAAVMAAGLTACGSSADTASAAVTSHSGGAQQADGSCGQGQNHRTQRFRHQKTADDLPGCGSHGLGRLQNAWGYLQQTVLNQAG